MKNIKKIKKEAVILLIAVIMILSTATVTANTKENIESFSNIKNTNIGPLDTFTEGFEDGIMPPTDWLNIDYDGDGFLWKSISTGFAPHSGTYSAGSESYDAGTSTPLTPDNWLITPEMTATDATELSYWVAAQDPAWAEEHIEVWISTTGTTVPDDFTDQVDDYTCPAGSEAWFERIVDLSSYDGESINIAFRHCECTDWFWIKIDDITVSNVEFGGPEPLIADADGPYEAFEGESIQFEGSAAGGVPPYSFDWDFGNGDTADVEDPVYAYDAPGVYDVTLTVTDSAREEAVDVTTATINEIPCCFEVLIPTGFGFGLKADVTEICDESHTDVTWKFELSGGLFVIPLSPLQGTVNFAAGETKTLTAPLVFGLGSIQITFTIGENCDPTTVSATIIGPFVIVK